MIFLLNDFLCFVSMVTLTSRRKIPEAKDFIIPAVMNNWNTGSRLPVWAHGVERSSESSTSEAQRRDNRLWLLWPLQTERQDAKWGINMCISEAGCSEKERIMQHSAPLCVWQCQQQLYGRSACEEHVRGCLTHAHTARTTIYLIHCNCFLMYAVFLQYLPCLCVHLVSWNIKGDQWGDY